MRLFGLLDGKGIQGVAFAALPGNGGPVVTSRTFVHAVYTVLGG